MKSSTKAKITYNSKHYDAIIFRANKGASEYITDLARNEGKSKAQYIRDLIIEDATKKGNRDAYNKLDIGGGYYMNNG